MMDLENMHGEFSAPMQKDGMTILTGSAPVASIKDYQKEVVAYSKGQGHIFFNFKGYQPCHNGDEVIAATTKRCSSDP